MCSRDLTLKENLRIEIVDIMIAVYSCINMRIDASNGFIDLDPAEDVISQGYEAYDKSVKRLP